AHDEILSAREQQPGASRGFPRVTNRAGGLEGGITNGQVLRVRGALKPISTVPRALRTVDVSTGEQTSANHQRSDTCAVAPAAVMPPADASPRQPACATAPPAAARPAPTPALMAVPTAAPPLAAPRPEPAAADSAPGRRADVDGAGAGH